MSKWSFPYGEANCSALLKSVPEDFKVIEELDFVPDGAGEHLFVLVEKTGLNTIDVIDDLARLTGLSPRQIAYSGLKDKQAVTRQWLSLHLPGTEVELNLPPDAGYRILQQQRNSRKLRIGSHKYNRFEITLRQVEGWNSAAERQLQQLAQHGMANYFGVQRFGQRGDNVEQALLKLGRKRLTRQKRSLYLSSLRSFMFNQVLSKRISGGVWDQPLPGDVFMLRGSRSFFTADIDEKIRQRFQLLDISSGGSLYGLGTGPLQKEAVAIEQAVFSENQPICERLTREKLSWQMRPHRVAVDDLQFSYDAKQRIVSISCRLAAGSYLTTLLDHVLKTGQPAA